MIIKIRSPSLRGIAIASLLFATSACERGSFFSSAESVEARQQQLDSDPLVARTEISAEFISKAAAALPAAWPKGAQVIQLKVLPERLEIQGGFPPKRDLEGQPQPSVFVLSFQCEVDKACGFSQPQDAQLASGGRYEDNLFALSLLHLEGIARSISIARKSVDPERGRVTEIRARRFLPFSKAVRVRYYIESPLMPGTMDANGRGIPLKR